MIHIFLTVNLKCVQTCFHPKIMFLILVVELIILAINLNILNKIILLVQHLEHVLHKMTLPFWSEF